MPTAGIKLVIHGSIAAFEDMAVCVAADCVELFSSFEVQWKLINSNFVGTLNEFESNRIQTNEIPWKKQQKSRSSYLESLEIFIDENNQ